MKKLLALSLALVMALGMTSVALAVEATYTVNPTGYKTTDGVVDVAKTVAAGTNVTPGSVVYYQLLDDSAAGLTDADQVKGATIKQTWDMGKDFIDSVSIVKKKLSSDSIYYYFVCVTFKASTSTSVADFAGEISIKKSTTSTSGGVTTGAAFVATFNINGPFSFTNAAGISDIAAESTKLYNFGTSGTGALSLSGEQSFTFANGNYFDVDLTAQGKMLLYYDSKYNSTVAATYPSANLDFVSYNGASFNKIGELTILADPGTFLYAMNADGSLSTIKASYDEYEEAFKLSTRTLGKYVISDTELKLVAPVASSSTASSSTTTPVKTNPGTGAAA